MISFFVMMMMMMKMKMKMMMMMMMMYVSGDLTAGFLLVSVTIYSQIWNFAIEAT